MPKRSSPTSNRKTSGVTQESSPQEGWFEAIEIIEYDSKSDRPYLVRWAGIDPNTGKTYEPTWEPRKNCSPALLKTWKGKSKQAQSKIKSENQESPSVSGRRPTPISIASTPVSSIQNTPQSSNPFICHILIIATRRNPSLPFSTNTPQYVEKLETQVSEYTPSQNLPIVKTETSPTLRKKPTKKRKSSFKVVVPSKSISHSSREPVTDAATKQETPPLPNHQSSSEETPEESRPTKKRRLVRKVIEDSQPESHITVAPPAEKPLDIISIPSQSPAPLVTSQKNESPAPEPVAKEPSPPEVSRSRQSTPSQLPTRNRSLSPVTKVDSWLSIASDNDYEGAIAERTDTPPVSETLHSGTISHINDPPSVMDPSRASPVGPTGPSFTPIQTLQNRQSTQAQSVATRPGSTSPSISVMGTRVRAPIPVQRALVQSRRSLSGSSHQSFSSAVSLRERLQNVQNQAAYEQIRSLASYAKKTPSLNSSATGSSILSGGTSISSLSTTDLSNLKLVNPGEREKILAVSGSELQSRMTRGVLINKQSQIQQFCLNPTEASDELTETMKTLMTTCSAIATHPYLIITPPLANAELPEAREAEYLVASSGKFVALGKLLDALRGDKEVKIGIVLQNTKGMDLLEGFLRGKGIRVKRADGAGVREQQTVESRGGANVILVLGGKAGARAIVNRVDIVIAMDLSFNSEDDQVLRLRQHPINIDELVPVIRLVTVNSAEHVRLCLPSPYEIPSDRAILQGLVSATTILRNFNGMEIPNDDARYSQVAEFVRNQKETDIFGIRDIEGYMAGHRGLAGLALKRARSPTDEGSDRKRFKSAKPAWQQPSMLSLQHENDELHETLARKTQKLETLRSELHSLQSKFDTLTIAKEDVDARLEQSAQEALTLRNQMASAPQTDPLFLQHEIFRLTKSLESKTKDFDYLAARYQESSAAASESAAQVGELKKEVEALKRRVEMDVRAVSWEGEKKVLLEKVRVLEDQYKLLEEREQRVKRKETST